MMKIWLLIFAAVSGTVDAARFNCDAQITPIDNIQGNGSQSPYINQLVTVKGIVTGDFRGKEFLEGFFIQQLDADKNPQTSEGLFIHHKDLQQGINQGDVVIVKGKVSEQFDVTHINSVSAVKVCKQQQKLPKPIMLSMPLSGFDLESIEGMLVRFKEPVVVTDTYQYVKYGELTVSSELLLNPTSRYRPGQKVQSQYKKDSQNRLIIDDGSHKEFPVIDWTGKNRPVTMGQKMNVTGVMHYAFGKYKIQPTQAIELHEHIHSNKPRNTGGSLKVANFNLKNYFTTIDQGEQKCGPKKNFSCRGADSTEEYSRQIKKLVAAINLGNADVLSIQELENVKKSTAVLVEALNEDVGSQKWSYIETGILGDDVIRVGILYQPERVNPLGDYALLNHQANVDFDETKHRVLLAQTFVTQNDNKFNLIAAHFKSKSCQDAKAKNRDQKDGQSCYNFARSQVATLVGEWLKTDPTGQGAKYTIMAGDLNSYQKEDPIVILGEHGLSNLADQYLGEKNWTASYRGYVGSLDYILVNSKAKAKATGLTQWHINSIHNPWFDYNLESFNQSIPKPKDLYTPSPLASSDHDMVIAGFDL